MATEHNIIPTNVIVVTSPNNIQPSEPVTPYKDIGIYVPNTSK